MIVLRRHGLRHNRPKQPYPQHGINMVDLMMWLVIAALLLAAAIQGIGYYQQASYLHQMKSDAAGAGANAQAYASENSGSLDSGAVTAGASASKWSTGDSYTVVPSNSGGKPLLKVSNPANTVSDVYFVFDSCAGLQVGINVVPKGGTPSLDSCVGVVSPLATWTQSASTASGMWWGLASSATGTHLAAVQWGGYAYTSADSGASWTLRSGSGSRSFDGLASSADGAVIVASDHDGTISRSSDGGTTWSLLSAAGTAVWNDIAMSSDGSKIVASEGGASGRVHLSADGGSTWTIPTGAPATGIGPVAMSADGSKIAVSGNTGLWTSSDGGSTWSQAAGGAALLAQKIAVSSDGKTILATVDMDTPHISTDGGSTWHAVSVPKTDWFAASVSADGTRMLASVANSTGTVYVSTDSGATWTAQTGLPTGQYYAATLSPDGTHVAAAPSGGKVSVGTLG